MSRRSAALRVGWIIIGVALLLPVALFLLSGNLGLPLILASLAIVGLTTLLLVLFLPARDDAAPTERVSAQD